MSYEIYGLNNWESNEKKDWKLENVFKLDVYRFLDNLNSKTAIDDAVVVNGKKLGSIVRIKLSASFFQADGLPDTILCVNGRFVAVELKRPNGKLKLDQ